LKIPGAVRMKIPIDGRTYHVRTLRRTVCAPSAPRLITVCYNNTALARDITRVCIQSIERFTPAPYELWVVDNNSPPEHIDWLCSQPRINIILNETVPVPQLKGPLPWFRTQWCKPRAQMKHGSYANAIGLELAVRIIDPATQYVFVMHNDVLVCHSHWLQFMFSKMNNLLRGVAASQDRIRVRAMHVSGILFDFNLYKMLNMSFLPNIPVYDVGDLITLRLRDAGYNYYICRNTFNNLETIDRIPVNNKLHDMYCDRVFDDNDNVIYLHLGRGTPKAEGRCNRIGKTYPEEWINYAEKHLLV